MEGYRSPERLEAVQVLRAVAALLVVVIHAINANDFRTDMPRSWLGGTGHLNDFGASGVDMFFVISGFIMALVMQSASSAGQFAALRFIRVVPAYWLASLAFLGVVFVCGHSYQPPQYWSIATVFPLTSAAGYAPPVLLIGWSLAFELAFYCVVALAIACVASPGKRFAFAFQLVCLLGLLGFIYVPATAIGAVFINPVWFEFALGMAAHWLWTRVRPDAGLATGFTALGLGLFWLGKSAIEGFDFPIEPKALIWQDPAAAQQGPVGLARALEWALPFTGVLLGLLWLMQSRIGSWMAQTRLWGFLMRLGDASYSLYLLHLGVIFLWQDLAPANRIDPELVIAALVGVNVALALFVHRWVEAPLIGWLRRAYDGFTGQIRGVRQAA